MCSELRLSWLTCVPGTPDEEQAQRIAEIKSQRAALEVITRRWSSLPHPNEPRPLTAVSTSDPASHVLDALEPWNVVSQNRRDWTLQAQSQSNRFILATKVTMLRTSATPWSPLAALANAAIVTWTVEGIRHAYPTGAVAAAAQNARQGQIHDVDLLIHIFTFLPPRDGTLVAVSHTCRMWRILSGNLPHWGWMPRVLNPFWSDDGSALQAALMIVEPDVYPSAMPQTQAEYMDVMRRRSEAVRAVADRLQEFDPSVLVDWRQSRAVHAVVGLVTATSAIAAATGIGWTAASDDLSVGAESFFTGMGFALLNAVFHMVFGGVMQVVSAPIAQVRAVGVGLAVWMPALIMLALCTPSGLLGARVSQASTFAGGSAWTVSGRQDCTGTVPESPSQYTVLEKWSGWTVQPFAPQDSSAAQKMKAGCPGVVANGTVSWLEAYRTGLLQNTSTTCADAGGASSSIVYLVPPPSPSPRNGSCGASLGVIAALWKPSDPALRAVVLGQATASGSVMFRTQRSTVWFSVPYGGPAGEWWYTASSSRWRTDGIPLVSLSGTWTPGELYAKWLPRLIGVWVAALGLFVAFAVVPLLVIHDSSLAARSVIALGMLLVANPVYLLIFGILCTVDPSNDACLMSGGNANVLVLVLACPLVIAFIFVFAKVVHLARSVEQDERPLTVEA